MLVQAHLATRKLAAVAAAVVVTCAIGTSAASATARLTARTSNGWSQVTPAGTDITADIGLARGNDGVLHVLWTTSKFESQSIMDTPVSPAGLAGRPLTITSGWFNANPPDATATPHGLYVFWNGAPSDSPFNPAINEASRPLKGGKWSSPRVAAPLFDQAIEDVTDTAATGISGKPWVSFTLTDTLAIYPTTDNSVQVIPPSDCCVYDSGLALDGGSKTMWVSYLSLISGHEGIFAQKLSSTGKASGRAILLPKSSVKGNVVEVSQRVGIAGRGPGKSGVYAAYGSGYPRLGTVDVVRVGSASPKVLARAGSNQTIGAITLAPGAGGRIWVAWEMNEAGGPAVFDTESNPAVTSFAKATKVTLPKGTGVVWKVYLNASGSKVDVLALTGKTINSAAAYWARVVS